ncbi:MAG: class I SAM-dependent methyltransferase, partial [Planctomycetota bacterium]
MTALAIIDRMRTAMAILLVLAACAAVSAADGGPAGAKEQADRILEASGVRGGLVVHLGCGDGSLTAALRANRSFMVHGLDRDPKSVAKAREHVRSLGLYGKSVSVDRLAGSRLPYVDNLVNLIVAEDLGNSGIGMKEVMRVLCPNGVAYLKQGGKWTRTVKPRPSEIDEWTHFMHDPSNNAVAHDSVVGPPRHLQWVGSPRWSRMHDHMSSVSALVSANGRLFYIFDEGPRAAIELPPKWMLIARDAFNGTVLWKRPIRKWHTHLWPLKSGPAHLPRRIVAIGDTLYATPGIDAPVTALDAATGKTMRTYQGTQATEEMIVADGVLFLVVNDNPV